MSFIYYKLPYKNKLLEPAVTKQQVSKDRVLFKPRAFQNASKALALIPMSRLHLLPNSVVSNAVQVPKEWAKQLQALTPSGGCRSLCLGAQEDILTVRGKRVIITRSSDGCEEDLLNVSIN